MGFAIPKLSRAAPRLPTGYCYYPSCAENDRKSVKDSALLDRNCERNPQPTGTADQRDRGEEGGREERTLREWRMRCAADMAGRRGEAGSEGEWWRGLGFGRGEEECDATSACPAQRPSPRIAVGRRVGYSIFFFFYRYSTFGLWLCVFEIGKDATQEHKTLFSLPEKTCLRGTQR